MNHVGRGSNGEAVMDPAGAEVRKSLDDDNEEEKPAGTAV